MSIVIKPMETTEEVKGKAYVHYRAWQETYRGLVDPGFLDGRTLEMSERYAQRAFENGYPSLIAKDGEKVIGFADYGAYRGSDPANAGEVYAIYILKDYYDRGIGRALMQEALSCIPADEPVIVWVLKGNERAIRFYTRCGFRPDGVEQKIKLGTESVEIRMILNR